VSANNVVSVPLNNTTVNRSTFNTISGDTIESSLVIRGYGDVPQVGQTVLSQTFNNSDGIALRSYSFKFGTTLVDLDPAPDVVAPGITASTANVNRSTFNTIAGDVIT